MPPLGETVKGSFGLAVEVLNLWLMSAICRFSWASCSSVFSIWQIRLLFA